MNTMTLKEFYKDQKRARSGELDFGVWWRGAHYYPTFRVSWVIDTGEVYAINLQDNTVEIIGISKGNTEEASRAGIEALLEGWADACGKTNSLQWIRNKFI